jgi:hypothetical protein
MDVQETINNMIMSSLALTGGIIALSTVFTIVVIVLVRRYVRGMTGGDLRNAGIPAQATVIKFWDTGASINDNPVAGLLLEVRGPNGAPYQVQTKSMIPRLSVGMLQPGAIVQVKIDPQNQQRVALDLFAGS